MDTMSVDLAPLGGEQPVSVTVRFYYEKIQDQGEDIPGPDRIEIAIEQGGDAITSATFLGRVDLNGGTYVIGDTLTDIVAHTLLHARDLNLDFPEGLVGQRIPEDMFPEGVLVQQIRWDEMRQELMTHTETLAQPARVHAITSWFDLGEEMERVMLRDALAILDAWVTIDGGESLDERVRAACDAHEGDIVREAVESWEAERHV